MVSIVHDSVVLEEYVCKTLTDAEKLRDGILRENRKVFMRYGKLEVSVEAVEGDD